MSQKKKKGAPSQQNHKGNLVETLARLEISVEKIGNDIVESSKKRLSLELAQLSSTATLSSTESSPPNSPNNHDNNNNHLRDTDFPTLEAEIREQVEDWHLAAHSNIKTSIFCNKGSFSAVESGEQALVLSCAREIEETAESLCLNQESEACISVLIEALLRPILRQKNSQRAAFSPQYPFPALRQGPTGREPSVDYAFSFTSSPVEPHCILDAKKVSNNNAEVRDGGTQMLLYMGALKSLSLVKGIMTNFQRWDFYVLDKDLNLYDRAGKIHTQIQAPPTITFIVQENLQIRFDFSSKKLMIDQNFKKLVHLLDTFINWEPDLDECKKLFLIDADE